MNEQGKAFDILLREYLYLAGRFDGELQAAGRPVKFGSEESARKHIEDVIAAETGNELLRAAHGVGSGEGLVRAVGGEE